MTVINKTPNPYFPAILPSYPITISTIPSTCHIPITHCPCLGWAHLALEPATWARKGPTGELPSIFIYLLYCIGPHIHTKRNPIWKDGVLINLLPHTQYVCCGEMGNLINFSLFRIPNCICL